VHAVLLDWSMEFLGRRSAAAKQEEVYTDVKANRLQLHRLIGPKIAKIPGTCKSCINKERDSCACAVIWTLDQESALLKKEFHKVQQIHHREFSSAYVLYLLAPSVPEDFGIPAKVVWTLSVKES